MAWKKILLEGDAAELSSATPVAIIENATGSVGIATQAARADHVHGSPATWAPDTHLLGGADHTADTLANLNVKISDATLDDSSASRPPSAHGLDSHSVPTSTIDFNQQQLDGMVLESASTPPDSGIEVEAQIYFDSDAGDKHAYLWVA